MFQVARVTDALPSLAAVPFALVLEDFESISYSPRLLLPASLPSVVVNDAAYAFWCGLGFDSCSYDDYDTSSLPALRSFILKEMFPGPSDDVPLVQHVGFLHGLLSALAITNRDLALAGLDILTYLTDHFVFLSKGCL